MLKLILSTPHHQLYNYKTLKSMLQYSFSLQLIMVLNPSHRLTNPSHNGGLQCRELQSCGTKSLSPSQEFLPLRGSSVSCNREVMTLLRLRAYSLIGTVKLYIKMRYGNSLTHRFRIERGLSDCLGPYRLKSTLSALYKCIL